MGPAPEAPPAAPTTETQQQQDHCPKTLHIARAIIAHATAPFPEIAAAISAAFIAFLKGRLIIDTSGPPGNWTAIAAQA